MGNAREEEREWQMKEKLGKGNKDTCGGRSVGSTVKLRPVDRRISIGAGDCDLYPGHGARVWAPSGKDRG